MLYVNLIFSITLLIYFFWLFALLRAFWSDAPYVPMRQEIVRMLVDAVQPRPGQLWIDLGSGDARILIDAVKRYRVRGIGIEKITAIRWLSRLNIIRSGLFGKIRIRSGNFFTKDLSSADIVSFYLLPEANARLYEKLKKELRPGARIVSHRFTIEKAPLVFEDAQHKIYVSEITGS